MMSQQCTVGNLGGFTQGLTLLTPVGGGGKDTRLNPCNQNRAHGVCLVSAS